MGQVGINGDGEWATTIKYLIKDSNARPVVQLTMTSGHTFEVVGSAPCGGKLFKTDSNDAVSCELIVLMSERAET